MIWSNERLRRMRVSAIAPAMLIVVILPPTNPDPVTKRPTGYAGVIPVPTTSTSAQSTITRLDPLLDGRRDTRPERGRVLYAAGHAPTDSTVALAAPRHRHPCPDQRIGQTSPRQSAPNS